MPTPYSYDRRYPSQAERDLFAKFNQTGHASDYPTYEQWKSVYTTNNWNRDLYNKQRRIKLGGSQSVAATSSLPMNYGRYIPSSGTHYIMTGAPAPSLERTAAPATNWDALHSRLGEPTAVDYMTADGLSSDRNGTSRTATPPASTPRTGTAVAAKPGETVAAMWTRVTGLPWKTAKEMGLTDGSYAQNIEILKGLKSGSITKDSVYSKIANQAVAPAETVDLSGMQRTDDYEPVPEAAPVTESGTPYTRAMAGGGFVRRYVPVW